MAKCTGKRCPMQYGYKVEECNQTDCPYRTEPVTNADRIRAMSDEELEKIADFLMALSEAQDNGQKEFTCPLCGGTVKMVRAPGNGHIHAACAGCGTKVCE